jgi:iron complex transport system ATP-binding protein
MLAVHEACVRIGSVDLLREVTLELAGGEVVAVVGPNGAGKSTLMALLAADIPPSAGLATLDGRSLARWAPRQRARRCAVLPQSGSVAFDFTAAEVVAMGRYPHHGGIESRRDLELAARAMRATGVGPLAGRAAGSLSGGELQRVLLARAMAQVAEGLEGRAPACYLLLDEPTSALDLSHQHECLELLRSAARAGAGVCVVLHDLNLARRYADRVVVLAAGRVVAEGAPADVLAPGLLAEVFAIDAVLAPDPRGDEDFHWILTRGRVPDGARSA